MKGWKPGSWWSGNSSASDKKNAVQNTDVSLQLGNRCNDFFTSNPKPSFLECLTEIELLQLYKLKSLFLIESFAEMHLNYPAAYNTFEEDLSKTKLLILKTHHEIQIHDQTMITELDIFLLRFLRARQFDLNKAEIMIKDYLKWRITFHVKDICETVRFPWISQLRHLYPHGYHGTDKTGRPVYIERIGKADILTVLKLASTHHLMSYWVQQYEYLSQIILPACSIAAGRRIEQSVTILDLSGLGISHVCGQSRLTMKQLAKLSQNYYPEMLGCMIIVNAPIIFSPLWNFSKSLLDEVTVSKITLLTSRSTHWKQYLQQLIAPDQLPQFLGGTCSDELWPFNSCGPWKNPDILNQLKQRHPHLEHNFIHFNIEQGDEKSLQCLDTTPDLDQDSLNDMNMLQCEQTFEDTYDDMNNQEFFETINGENNNFN